MRSARTFEWIAHKGECHDAPENTMASINLAWQRGADAVEFDCHLTRDNVLALNHDADTLKVAKHKLIIAESTFAQLRELDFGAGFSPAFSGERIASVDEVLQSIPAGKRVFAEIKVGPEAVPVLKECMQRTNTPATAVVMISFNAETVAMTRKLLPDVTALKLTHVKQDGASGQWSHTAHDLIAQAQSVGALGIDVSADIMIDRALVQHVKAAGLSVYVWTVDRPDIAQRMIDAGVDGITTNKPAWLRKQVVL